MKYTVDFTNVQNYLEIHFILMKSLDFPDHYGCNWDAFWDCLTDMYGDTIHIEVIGLDIVAKKFEGVAEKILEILTRFKHYANNLFSEKITIEVIFGKSRQAID